MDFRDLMRRITGPALLAPESVPTAGDELSYRLENGRFVLRSRADAPAEEVLTGNELPIANGDTGYPTFDTKTYGDDLLDLTDPAFPLVEAGTYTITLNVDVEGQMLAGGVFHVVFQCVDIESGAGLKANGWVYYAGDGQAPGITLNASGVVPGIGELSCSVFNNGGVELPFNIIRAQILKTA